MVAARILAAALVFATGAAQAATTLTGLGDGSVRFITDGTSNTIQLGENSRASLCFQNITTGFQFGDGSVRTIRVGESVGLPFSYSPTHLYNFHASITDGSSNTIFLSELPIGGSPTSYCVTDTQLLDPIEIPDGTSNTIIVGENGRFDICFNNVRLGTIADGTSNTIQFGENQPRACFNNIAFADNIQVDGVPVPGMGVLLALGLAGLGVVAVGRARLGR